MQWLQGKTSETISPRWTLAVYSAPWLFSLRQVTLHLGLIKTLKCSKLDYQPDTGVTVASQIWGNRQQQSVRQSWVVMGGKSTNFRTGGPQAQCPKHATRRKFHPSHSIRKVRWHFANYPFRKKTPHPAMASAHHHMGFSILALQLPGTGIRTHARHCGVTSTLCAKGGCFVCVLRTCSSLRCSSRRHPRKPQPRGLPESPIFWKEQPCKIRRVLLSCLPSLSVITILNKMNECHTLS